MTINDLKQLADGEYVDKDEVLEFSVKKLTEKPGTGKGPFWYGAISDDTGEGQVTFFNKAGQNCDFCDVQVYGKGIKKDSYNGKLQLSVYQGVKIDRIQGGSPPGGSKQDPLPGNMSPVSGQKEDGVAFHTMMRMMSLFYLHCWDYAMLIQEKAEVKFTEGQLQQCLTSLWMTGKENGLATHKAPRLADMPSHKQEPPPVRQDEPEPPPDDPGPSYQEQKKEQAAEAKKQMEEIDEMEEEDVPF